MQRILSVENMRKSDAHTIEGGIPGRELMYRAGVSIVRVAEEKGLLQTAKVAIVCGSGNNAGDGYVIALLLADRNIECELLLCDDRFSEDGRHYYDMCLERNIPSKKITDKECDFSCYKVIFDCIYGTGFHGEVKEPVSGVITAINEAGQKGAYVVSVDINSGLNGKNGMTTLAVKSDLTISVGDYQPGHFLNMAKDYIKEKTNCPIGIEPLEEPFLLMEKEDVAKCFPERKNFANKGTYGYIALIGGSLKYSGAIRLASMANASMRCGAGVTTVAVPKGIAGIVASKVLESTLFPLSDREGEVVFSEGEIAELIKNRKTVAFGMGIGKSKETADMLCYLLKNYSGTLIVDADGLNCLAEFDEEEIKTAAPKLVLTPHIKEFSRLYGMSIADIQADPVEAAREYARKTGAIVLLKGPATIVTDGEKVLFTDRGSAGMATAGSGDVLSGIIAAVCAFNGDSLLESTAASAYINGLAGELAEQEMGAVSMVAGDTAEHIAEAINSIC